MKKGRRCHNRRWATLLSLLLALLLFTNAQALEATGFLVEDFQGEVASWEEGAGEILDDFLTEGGENFLSIVPLVEEAEEQDSFGLEGSGLDSFDQEEEMAISELVGLTSDDFVSSILPAEDELVSDGEAYTFSLGVLTLLGRVDATTIAWDKLGGKAAVEEMVAEDGASLGENCEGLFAGLTGLTKADLSAVDTSNCRSLARLFEGCGSLKEVNLSSLDLPRLTSVKGMFAGCSSLTACNLTDFYAERVSDLSGLFQGCSSLTEVDLSSWSCSYAEDLSYCFDGCKSLKSVQLSDFIGSETITMKGMFRNCASLASLDISQLDFSFTKDISEMFKGCSLLGSLDLSAASLDQVETMASALEGAISLQEVSFPTEEGAGAAVTDASRLFADCKELKKVSLLAFTKELKDQEMFLGAESITSITLRGSFSIHQSACLRNDKGGWVLSTNPQEVINPSLPYADFGETLVGRRIYLFKENILLPYEFLDEGKTLMLGAYEYNKNTIDFSPYRDQVEYIKVKPGEKVSLVGDCSHMFENLSFLREIELSAIDFKEATDISFLFKGCVNLKEAHFDTGDTLRKLTDVSSLFDGCTNLEKATLPRVAGDSLKSIRRLCADCKNLREIETRYFDTQGVKDMTEAFLECNHLLKLDLQSWVAKQVENCQRMFYGCSIFYLYLPEFNGAQIQDAEEMFMHYLPKELSVPGGFAVTEQMSLHGIYVKKISHKGYANEIPAQVGRTIFDMCFDSAGVASYFNEEGKVDRWYADQIVRAKVWFGGPPSSGSYIVDSEYRVNNNMIVDPGENMSLLLKDGAKLQLDGNPDHKCDIFVESRGTLSLFSDKIGSTGEVAVWNITGGQNVAVDVNGGVLTIGNTLNCPITVHGGKVSVGIIGHDCKVLLDWKIPGTEFKATSANDIRSVELRNTFLSLSNPSILITAENIKTYMQDGIISGCKVTFDSTGGSSVSDQYVLADGKATIHKPVDPVRRGYIFKGWEYESKAYDFTKPVTCDAITLTAVWDKMPFIPYLDEYEVLQQTDDYSVLEDTDEVLRDGCYYVNKSMRFDSLEVKGNVSLILADGCQLYVADGVKLEDPFSLTIYGQEQQTGRMFITKSVGLWVATSISLGAERPGKLIMKGAALAVENANSEVPSFFTNITSCLCADVQMYAGEVQVRGKFGYKGNRMDLVMDWTSPHAIFTAQEWYANIFPKKNCMRTGRSPDLIQQVTHLDGIQEKIYIGPACEIVLLDEEEKVIDRSVTMVDGEQNASHVKAPTKEGYSFVGWEHDGEIYDLYAPIRTDYLDLHMVWKKLGPKFTSFGLALGGELGLYFYMDLPGAPSEYRDAYMQFTVCGKTQKVIFSEAEHLGNTTYGFPVKLNILQMADEITATFTSQNGVEEITYTVLEYLSYFREHSKSFDEKTVTLAERLADFGHYSQPFLAAYNNWTVGKEHAFMPCVHEITEEDIAYVR